MSRFLWLSATGTCRQGCPLCGCGFAVRFVQNCLASRWGRDHDFDHASAVAERALRLPARAFACPDCGRQSPRRVGATRQPWDALRGLFAAGVAGVVALLGVLDPRVASSVDMLAGVALLAVAALLGQVGIAAWFGYAGNWTSRAQAARLRSEGRYVVEQPGEPGFAGNPPVPSRALGSWLTLTAAALAGLGWGAIAAGRLGPLSPAVTPVVVGPGSVVRVTFDETFQSIDGMWHGTPTVTVRNAAEFPGLPAAAEARSRVMPATNGMFTKSKPGQTQTARPWVEVVIPDDPRLVGRRLTLDVRADVEYPRWGQGQFFDVETATVTKQVEVTVASADEESSYLLVVFGCLLVAAALLAAGEGWCNWATWRMTRMPPRVAVEMVGQG